MKHIVAFCQQCWPVMFHVFVVKHKINYLPANSHLIPLSPNYFHLIFMFNWAGFILQSFPPVQEGTTMTLCS